MQKNWRESFKGLKLYVFIVKKRREKQIMIEYIRLINIGWGGEISFYLISFYFCLNIYIDLDYYELDERNEFIILLGQMGILVD